MSSMACFDHREPRLDCDGARILIRPFKEVQLQVGAVYSIGRERLPGEYGRHSNPSAMLTLKSSAKYS
jgi:hypothetical protein